MRFYRELYPPTEVAKFAPYCAQLNSSAMVTVYVREADKWKKNGLDGLGF